jgi:tetratricopeptide (TPR) repeat protein
MHAEILFESTEKENLVDEGTPVISQASRETAKKTLDFCSAVARVCYGRGYWSECELIGNTTISIGRSLNEPAHIGWRLYDMCRINFQRNDLRAARRLAIQAIEAWEPLGQASEVYHIHRLMGQIEQESGNVESAERFLILAIDGYKKLSDGKSSVFILDIEADLAALRGDVKDASDKYRQAVELAQSNNNIGYAAALLYHYGQLAFDNGDAIQAREHHEKSLDWAYESHSANLIARNLCSLAMIAATNKDDETAKEFARLALARCRRLGIKQPQAEMEKLLNRLEQSDIPAKHGAVKQSPNQAMPENH